MAFTVETGAIVANANAYVSVTAAKAYWDDRGVSYAAYTDSQLEKAIVRATSYIDASYTFKGTLVDEDQTLSWPRAGVVDKNGREIAEDVIPPQVIAATCELAHYSLTESLTSVVTGSDRVKRVKAGSAEVEFEASALDEGTRYAFVDRLLAGLIAGGTSMIRETVRGW